jgi:GR25 family glycosyltransferase involved in LPS biosynthesis
MRMRVDQLHGWIINLNRCHDRWTRSYRSLSQVFSEQRLHRVEAIDGMEFLETGYDGSVVWKPEVLNRLLGQGMLVEGQLLDPVRVALCLSHQQALREFLHSGEAWGIIFEDDVQVGRTMEDVVQRGGWIEPPEDAEVMFLHDRVKSRKIKSSSEWPSGDPTGLRWREVGGGVGLEAYAVSQAGALKILQAWKPLALECDIQLMTFLAGYVENRESSRLHRVLGKVRREDASLIRAYCPHRPLFQADEQVVSVKLKTMGEVSSAGQARRDNLLVKRGYGWSSVPAGSTARLCETMSAPRKRKKSKWAEGEELIEEVVGGPRYSFCVTCKGRLDHLMETLPVNLEVLRKFGDSELVLLNYNSPDGMGDYVLDHFKSAMQAGLLRFATTRQPEKFRMAHAKNVCHKLGRGEFLVNLDADHFLNEDYMRALSEATESGKADVCTFVYDKLIYGGGFGRVVIRRTLFNRVGGYDEDHLGYGHEDFDLVERATRVGGKLVKLASPTAQFIRHGDERRMLIEKDRGTEAAKWEAFFKAKWQRGEWIANQGRPWGVVNDLEVRPGDGQLTVVLTNYRRTGNIRQILDSIPAGAELVLLDNAPPGFEVPVELVRRSSWYLKSDGNDLVLRWMLAARARTKFVDQRLGTVSPAVGGGEDLGGAVWGRSEFAQTGTMLFAGGSFGPDTGV